MTAPPTRARSRPATGPDRGERSRQAALATARTLLATRGFSGMTVSRLCRESGLSPGSIYWHFGSKEGVLAAVVQQGVEELLAKVPHPAEFTGEPIERFAAVSERIAQVVEEEPESLKLLLVLTLQEDGDEQVRAVVREMRERALRSWEESLRTLLAPDGDAEGLRRVRALALLGRAVADGALIGHVADHDVAVNDVFRTFVVLLRALTRDRHSHPSRPEEGP